VISGKRNLEKRFVAKNDQAQAVALPPLNEFVQDSFYGIEAAARLYLGKSAADLNLAEAALLAAVGRSPALNPFARRRPLSL
jgi:hypothetical protein